MPKTTDQQLFDEWPERYNDWFATPIGRLVLDTELDLVLRYVRPQAGERILDAGCGTGIFTRDLLTQGAEVTGLDISGQMLRNAVSNLSGTPFSAIQGDITSLPFADDTFDKAVSITALEFIEDGQKALDELFRVTRPGGSVIVATLNSLSQWAVRRQQKTIEGEGHILENAFYRSPADMMKFTNLKGEYETVVHFPNDANPDKAVKIEQEGKAAKLDSGAFLAVRWDKPV